MADDVKYPQIVAPVHGPALSSAEFAAKEGGATVTMYFEKDVLFTPAHGTRVKFTKGVHEVPEAFTDHWYLRNNQASVYIRPVALGAPAPAEPSPKPEKAAADKPAGKAKAEKAEAAADKPAGDQK